MNNGKIIDMSDVRKTYKRGIEEVHALDGINLAVNRGEFFSVIGPSGSGKTTFLNIIGCVDRPTSGSISIDGVDVSHENEEALAKIRREKIGFVFQQFFLIPTLSVLENVQVPGMFSKNEKRVEYARELIEMVGLSGRIDHRPSQLSGGEMQRVAIARALLNKPEILLADEPTGNLDVKNAHAIYSIFERLNAGGLTIIVVTHNVKLAEQTKRIIRIEDGKVV